MYLSISIICINKFGLGFRVIRSECIFSKVFPTDSHDTPLLLSIRKSDRGISGKEEQYEEGADVRIRNGS